jgi:nitronate monooxygenase
VFGVQLPLILSPMAGPGTPELAAAVSNAGGLGSVPAAYLSPAKITEAIARTRALTSRPIAVNLFVHSAGPLARDPGKALSAIGAMHAELDIAPPTLPAWPIESLDAQFAAVLEAKVEVFSFTFGIPPAAVLAAFRAAGTKIVGTATHVAEAEALAAAGVDAIVTQGGEAGAHRGTFIGRFEDALVPLAELVPQVARAVSQGPRGIPVIAAGGIRTGQDVRRMLGLGAAAAQIGTAFIPCPESAASPSYKQAVLGAAGGGVRPGETVGTRAVSGRAARGLPNRLIRDLEALGDDVLPYPWQNAATRQLRTAAAKADRPEFLSLWAGEGAGPIRPMPAGELVALIAREAGLM